MYFVMAMYEVTPHAPKIFMYLKSPRMLQKHVPFSASKMVSSYFFISLQVSPESISPRGGLRKIEGFERSVCTETTAFLLVQL